MCLVATKLVFGVSDKAILKPIASDIETSYYNKISSEASLDNAIYFPGVASSIPARTYTFVEIDHEIISTVILRLPLIQERTLSVTSESMCTKYWLTAYILKLAQEKVWFGELTDRLYMTIAVDWDIKPQQTNKIWALEHLW